MAFIIDKQTLADLQVAANATNNSIYELFNHCRTQGGERLLLHMFQEPLSSVEMIRKRIDILSFLSEKDTHYPLDISLFNMIENYLSNTDERTRLKHDHDIQKKLTNKFLGIDSDTQLIQRGIQANTNLFKSLRSYLVELKVPSGHAFFELCDELLGILKQTFFTPVFDSGKELSTEEFIRLDGIFRFEHRDALLKILWGAYMLDVYLAVAAVGKKQGFCFPEPLPPTNNATLIMKGVYHPLVKNVVANDFMMNDNKTMIFLTGANMAGKSTIMKAISITVLLAHMGFPVPAKEMRFSVMDGIYTTINLPDNLGIGASHFYAEVLRVKKVVQDLAAGKRLFVVFDEMFRGTNVKDAYEATISVCSGYAKHAGSLLIISTHITEASEPLKAASDAIDFLYLPTEMDGEKPRYTYRLQSGVTTDRHGMVIIQQEGILDMLASGNH